MLDVSPLLPDGGPLYTRPNPPASPAGMIRPKESEMAEKMTLERHAEKIRRIAEHMAKDGFGGWADSCVQAADAIDAHLSENGHD